MGRHRVAVAASGGRDSTALLHCTVRAAAPLGIEVVALHVHHGLNADAGAWRQQVRQQARRWGAAFDSRCLAEQPAAGDSIEAWARRHRYRALAEMAHEHGCSLVLLAHHRRDQAETWLLQALRGGGPRGLAAMPASAVRSGIAWARPWLDLPRDAIEAYLRRHRLAHVDDSSNTDPRFARNALRLAVWPALSAAFPQAEALLAAAARQARQAAALAEEVAALDLPGVAEDGALCMQPWSALPPARRRNVLQAWLAGNSITQVPVSLLDRLSRELPGRRSGRWPAPQAELRLHRGRLACHPLPQAAAPPAPACGLDLSRPGIVALPDGAGHFEVQAAASGGVDVALLRGVQALPRRGGERFRLTPRGLARSLKKQFQARAVPAWQREGPLLFTHAGQLLFVPGLGIDGAFQAPAGTPQLQLRWVPGRRQPGG